MNAIHVHVLFDRMQGDSAVYLARFQRPRESHPIAEIVMENTFHLQQTKNKNKSIKHPSLNNHTWVKRNPQSSPEKSRYEYK